MIRILSCYFKHLFAGYINQDEDACGIDIVIVRILELKENERIYKKNL